MPSNITISVITPCLNAARFIVETIESVRQQDFPNIEHIVIDGGSTDSTVEVLKSYPHLRWVSEPDNGQSQALNKGFAMAQGEILGWLNADDTYTPGAVQAAVQYLSEHPETDMVCSDMWILDENGAHMRLASGKPFNLVELLTENYVRQSTVFMRKRLLEQVGPVNEDLHFCMDRELWLRIGSGHRIDYLPNLISANFRIYLGTKTSLHTPKFVAEWLGVLKDTLTNPKYEMIPQTEKLKAIDKYEVRYKVAVIRQASKQKDLRTVVITCTALIKHHWRYLLAYPFHKIKAVVASKS